jgi:pimeloyl-ACP methyl ester carboxylesterase
MNKSINIAGKEIHYSVVGNGKPVMLVHGFGETADVWKHQAEHLKNKYKLIIPDLPGSGKSDIIDDMSMEGMAEILKTILDTESTKDLPQTPSKGGGDTVSMIGHSMGGYITLAFAAKFPNYLNAFGLFHSTAYADNEEKKATRQKGIEFIQQHGAFEFLKTATVKLFSDKTRDERPELVDEQIAGLKDFTAAALVKYYQSMIERPDRTDMLRNANMPVLFVIGEYDTAIPIDDMLKQSHLPAISHIHILKDCGHMGMLEKPLESTKILFEFLQP